MPQRVLPSVSSLIHISRPQIAAQAALYSALGAYLSGGLAGIFMWPVALAGVVVGLIVSFGFVINDYADLELDRRSKPQRPLPLGELSSAEALRLMLALALGALVVALALPSALFLFACTNLVLAALYSFRLKRTVLLGNIAMASLNSSVLLFGALATGRITTLVWAVAGMALFYSLAQEVLYTVADMEGDAEGGIVTTAIYFGHGPTLQLFRALIVLAALAALAPWWLTRTSPLYLLALLVCTIGPIMGYILPLTMRAEADAIRRACDAVAMVRGTSLIPLILLPVAG